MSKKPNDWVVAGLLHSDKSTETLLLSGLNTGNTQFLSEDEYKKSNFIKHKFTEDGKFNEEKFHEFYNERLQEFGKLQSLEMTDSTIYSPYDVRIDNRDLQKKVSPLITVNYSPYKQTFNNDFYTSSKSEREKAQKNKIWDPVEGKWLDERPEDRTLLSNPLEYIKNIFTDRLVYAKYDEDTEIIEPNTGQKIKKYKGEYKLDIYGNPYTELLSGRSLWDKEVVSNFDILTQEDSTLQKYDFFDSDGLDKSVTGTIIQSAASIAPLFMGNKVQGAYATSMLIRELLKASPMLYGIVSTPFTDNNQSNVFNYLGAWAQGANLSSSDYARSKALSFESLMSMTTDVALQWSQQKQLAKFIGGQRKALKLEQTAKAKAKEIFDSTHGKSADWFNTLEGQTLYQRELAKVEPIIRKAHQRGANASLVYMATISNTDIYNSMLEHGADKWGAASVTLGSMIGMFGVDRYLHLGESFFEGLTDETMLQIRRTLKNDAESWYNNIIIEGRKFANNSVEQKKFFLSKGLQLGKKWVNKLSDDIKNHTLNFVGKSITEGLEEINEELVGDIAKSFYEGITYLSGNYHDVGAFENAWSRYLMSGLGGAIGGGLFYGVDVYQNGKFRLDKTQDELIYLVRNGQTDKVLKELKEQHQKGKLGDTNLSYKHETDSDGNEVFLTAKKGESQNDFIYNQIRNMVIQLDDAINSFGGKLSDDNLYKQLLPAIQFQKIQQYLDLKGISYLTGYQQDYQNAVKDLLNAEAALKLAVKTKTGLVYNNDEALKENLITDEQLRNLSEQEKELRNANLAKIEAQIEQAKINLDSFIKGTNRAKYLEKLFFLINPEINQHFVSLTFDTWVKNQKNKDVKNLSKEDKDVYIKEYEQYLKGQQKFDIDRAFEVYSILKEKFKSLTEMSETSRTHNLASLNQVEDQLNEIFTHLASGDYTLDSLLPGETEESESYKNRNEEDAIYTPESVQEIVSRRISGKASVLNEKTTEGEAAEVIFIEIPRSVEGFEPSDFFSKFHVTNGYLEITDESELKDTNSKILDLLSDEIDDEGNIPNYKILGVPEFGSENDNLYKKVDFLYTNSNGETSINTVTIDSKFNLLDYLNEKTEETLPAVTRKEQIKQLNKEREDRFLTLLQSLSEESLPDYIRHRATLILNARRKDLILKQVNGLNIPLLSFDTLNAIKQLLLDLDYNQIEDDAYITEIQDKITSLVYSSASENLELNNILTRLNVALKGWSNFSSLPFEYAKIDFNNISEIIDAWKEAGSSIDTTNYIKSILMPYLSNKYEDAETMYDNLVEVTNIIYGGFENIEESLQVMYQMFKADKFTEAVEGSFKEGLDYTAFEDLLSTESLQEESQNLLLSFNNIIENLTFPGGFLHSIKEDPVFQATTKFENTRPAITGELQLLLSNLELSTTDNSLTVFDLLQSLYDRLLDADSIDDFILTEPEKIALNESEHLLKTIAVVIKSIMMQTEDFEDRGLYAMVVDTLKHSKDSEEKTFGEVNTTIDEFDSNLLIKHIEHLLSEIGSPTEQGQYTPFSWRWRSQLNEINKPKHFIEADKALHSSIVELFSSRRDDFKFKIGDNEYDFLDGVTIEIPDKNNSVALASTANYLMSAFHRNFQALLKTGLSVTDIWQYSQLLDKIAVSELTGVEEFLDQSTSTLNPSLSLSSLTVFDQVMILMSAAALDSKDIIEYFNSQLEGTTLVPLTIQEWVSRTSIAMLNNPTVFNETMAYLYSKSKDSRILLQNTIFVAGNAGAGKSVAAGYKVANYTDKEVWIGAPSTGQTNNLFNSVGKGERMNFKDDELGNSFISRIIEDMENYKKASSLLDIEIDQDLSNDLYAGKYPEGLTDYFTLHSSEGNIHILKIKDMDMFKIKKEENPPKLVILDEATHLNTLDLQLISTWAKLNNVQVVLLGDTKQNGHSKLGFNLIPEMVIVPRTQVLDITLRDNNVHHYYNLSVIGELVTSLSSLTTENFNTVIKTVTERLKSLELRSYHETDYHGDRIVSYIDDEVLNKMEGTICVIGSPDSSIAKRLTDLGKEVSVFSVDAVQGREFDYVIVDNQVSSNTTPLELLRSFYTLMSRSRQGTIFVDTNDSIINLFGKNYIANYTATAPKIVDYMGQFMENKKAQYTTFLEKIKQLEIEKIRIEKPTDKTNNEISEELDTPILEEPNDAEEEEELPEEPSNTSEEKVVLESTAGDESFEVDTSEIEEVLEEETQKIEEADENLNDFNEIAGINEDVSSIKMLGYGQATFLGARYGSPQEDGILPLIIPKQKKGIKKDLGIFYGNEKADTYLNNIESQKEAHILLNDLQCALLYKTPYKSLPKRIKGLISEDEYNNVSYRLTVRSKDSKTDTFPRNSNYTEVSPTYKDKLYVVEAVFKTKSDEQLILTMGLLGRTEGWKNSWDRILDRLTKRLKNASEKQEEAINKKIQSNELHIKATESEFKSIYNKAVASGEEEFHLPIDKFITNGLTYLYKSDRKRPIHKRYHKLAENAEELSEKTKSPTKKKSLKERKNKYAQQAEKEVSFYSANADAVKSPIYVITADSEASKSLGIDPNLTGRKAVMFVSRNPSLDPKDLAKIYISQREQFMATESMDAETNTYTGDVRMIVLDTEGVDFAELSMDEHRAFLNTETEHAGTFMFPFHTQYVGARMFVSMWNYRANLLSFKKNLSIFKDKVQKELKSLSDSFTQEIIEQLNLLVGIEFVHMSEKNKQDIIKQIESILVSNNIKANSSSILDILQRNYKKAFENAKQFRFQADAVSDKGFFLGQIDSNQYSKQPPVGIYMDELTLEHQLNQISVLFSSVLDKCVTVNADPESTISVKNIMNKGSKLTISESINSNTFNITFIDENGEERTQLVDVSTTFDPSLGISKGFAHIPALLMKVKSLADFRNRQIDNRAVQDQNVKITWKDNEGEIQEVGINYSAIWKTLDLIHDGYTTPPSPEEFNKSIDNSLNYLFALMFHGTIEDWRNPKVYRTSDAPFPNGIYVDPIIENSSGITFNGKVVLKPVATNLVYYSTPMLVQKPAFYITLASEDNVESAQAIENTKPTSQVFLRQERTVKIDDTQVEEPVGTDSFSFDDLFASPVSKIEQITTKGESLNTQYLINNRTMSLLDFVNSFEEVKSANLDLSQAIADIRDSIIIIYTPEFTATFRKDLDGNYYCEIKHDNVIEEDERYLTAKGQQVLEEIKLQLINNFGVDENLDINLSNILEIASSLKVPKSKIEEKETLIKTIMKEFNIQAC